MTALFNAKYPGRCGTCDKRIAVDDLVTYDDGELVHAKCEASQADDQVDLTTVCPHCWLIHAGGCA
jgi:hypothetical protein